VGPSSNGGPDGDEDETEAIFDVEWSGAVAKNAKIDLVASKDATTTAGIDLSAEYIVNQKLAPILSESYGQCELQLGSSGNTFYSNLWSQAASEGITVSISSGDNGSDGCDFPPSSTSVTGAQEGVYGLGVNGLASTPYNVAVGGTDFNDHVTPNSFWSSSNASGTLASAQSYVPEVAWNDSCTNSLIYTAFGQASAAAACNAGGVQTDGNSAGFFFVAPTGGSGGVSNCTTASNGATSTSQCSGGYARPTWQTGPGTFSSDGKRDLPDVSFLAEGSQDSYGLEQAIGDKVPGSFYFACEGDVQGSASQPVACSTSGSFLLGGGTSISAQVFAGVMALLDQKSASSQGNINPTFYSLAASQSALNCNSSTTTLPNSACIFHDVTVGTNAMPCETPSTHDGTSDCSTAGGGPIGILAGYSAGAGYDLATGLGSINVANLIGGTPYLSLAASPATVTIPSPGQTGTTTVTFTAKNGFAGTVNNLACSGQPSGASCSFAQNGSSVSSLTFSNATTTASVTLTVSTTASSVVPPAVKFIGPSRWIPMSVVALAGIFLGALGLLAKQGNQRRWSPAIAFFGFALLLATAGCSGNAAPSSGSSSGGGTSTNGGTPTGSSTAVVSVTNGANNAVISLDLGLTVN
jgi:subtilase family serine protease